MTTNEGTPTFATMLPCTAPSPPAMAIASPMASAAPTGAMRENGKS